MVASLFSPATSTHFLPQVFVFHPKSIPFPLLKPRHRFIPSNFSASSTASNDNRKSSTVSSSINRNRPRTLFPGGYKRPEIKVPNLVLRLSSEEVLRDSDNVLDVIDNAVSDRVGIVVLNGEGASGKKLYEAACLLKSVIRDRSYLLIDERVDIAAAVNASGVLLSDQGLPSIVARNTMMGSNTESIVLPLVARNVQTSDAALDASTSEGADFLIYSVKGGSHSEELVNSVLGSVKIPIFITVDSLRDEFEKALDLLRLGASGIVVSVDELKMFRYDDLKKLFHGDYASNKKAEERSHSSDKLKTLDTDNGFPGKKGKAGFTKLDEKEQQFIEKERAILLEAIDAIHRAAPLMGEISLLRDAVSQLDEPFLLVIVGEFNSGKSSVINAFLGQRYLKDGVVPTTNEITFLRYSELDYNVQHCERHPDGQYICYLPAPVLKEMIIADTPGTNVILQRQQRLTEEFVPRADLILFVISADRPLTESEVTFLRYIQQWKKKVVFVLNKSDLFQNAEELKEAITFIKENAKKVLNTEQVMLFPVSARSALEAKLSAPSSGLGQYEQEQSLNASYQGAIDFSDLEKYLYSFLDGSTSTGIERMKLKLETPVKIAEQLLSASQKHISEECQQAREDLVLVNDLISSMKDFVWKMESKSISWKRQILSLINNTQARVINLAESTLQLSNLDLVTSYVFKGDKSAPMPLTSSLRNDTIDPAISEAKKLLGEYRTWLQSNNACQGSLYKESFEKRWPSFIVPSLQSQFEASELLKTKHEVGIKVIEDFSAAAASKLFEQEIREVFVGTFGGLGAAGLSASLLTSILPTTLEDLLALGLCSAGGLLAISNFPARRQKVIDKVRRTADALARQLEEAMQKELSETTENLNKFAELVGKPYKDMAQNRVDKLSNTLDELTTIEEKLKKLQIEIQNLHVSR
ncbi:probable transmembrane GTPase FZO-like, chloroplastic isoform X1 [Olea europaea subsp. europaea]|uniref:Probable transmembrane GTPase FZO-like, chloroplastic isoform X1 n=1 Tax=Olea europaea subsp. europaea TaxID=158383 RepID=A0A8S0VA85_OLEEU|nr:probable transmembrane GTPase FZO-like, chloroplastic isoform X1 [Olea europaea subsp. europaea]